jgi:hypothetical protein
MLIDTDRVFLVDSAASRMVSKISLLMSFGISNDPVELWMTNVQDGLPLHLGISILAV